MLALLAWTTSLSARITREQADAIVLEHIQKEETLPFVYLYVNKNTPSNKNVTITAYIGESIKVKYACWIYYLDEHTRLYGLAQRRRYFFVKEDSGSLLEIISHWFFSPDDSHSWEAVDITSGIPAIESSVKQPYPNPVNDVLTIPCKEESVHVKIYDLSGARHYTGLLSGANACQLNVSFLNPGVYIVSVDGETFKIIKN